MNTTTKIIVYATYTLAALVIVGLVCSIMPDSVTQSCVWQYLFQK
jgi:hypothetical protein